ncbi:MAG: PRC-barrel domain-containing protein [Steroidobacteraceae bacterium]
MLHSLNALRKFHVHAADGDIGEVEDGYFDDERWVVRYLVVNTGSWLSGREVLISPYSVVRVDDADSAIVTQLTRKQVQGSPSIDTAKPISRQQEESYLSYFGYPVYWPYTSLWAWGSMPVMIPPDPRLHGAPPPPPDPRTGSATDASAGANASARTGAASGSSGAVHLRSAREVRGYHIQGADDSVGHVEDFLFEEGTWAIRYLAVDTRNWLPGKHVLVPPQWITEVSWPERLVTVQLRRDEIEGSPRYDPKHLPTRGEETSFYKHYQRPGYW